MPTDDDLAWSDTRRLPRCDELGAPATQVVGDRDAYLGQGLQDVGRRIADDHVELFTAQDPAPALRQEFLQHASEFIALHDVGTSASLRVLGGLAGASGARVQRLSIRRQGQGVALAVLQFVEVPLADGTRVRVYATDVNADGAARVQFAQVLLGYSRLGVLMVGELPPHAMTSSLLPLRQAVARGPWPNRDLLMVPLGSGTALAAQAAQLAGTAAVAVHVAPRAAKPRQVWAFVAGAWNRLHGGPGGEHSVPTDLDQAVPRPPVPLPEAPTEVMPLDERPGPAWTAGAEADADADEDPADAVDSAPPPQPVHEALRLSADFDRRARDAGAPPRGAERRASARADAAPHTDSPRTPRALPLPVPGGTRWDDYMQRCVAVKGALGGCVFDVPTLQALAQAGSGPSAERLAQQGAVLLSVISDAARALGLGASRIESALTLGGHHLLLRAVPGHPGVALHLVLAGDANLTLARMQLERVAPPP